MKIEETLTLSVYQIGHHRREGKATKEDKKWNRMSFGESFSPLRYMVQSFSDLPLGTKIRVTMEVVDE